MLTMGLIKPYPVEPAKAAGTNNARQRCEQEVFLFLTCSERVYQGLFPAKCGTETPVLVRFSRMMEERFGVGYCKGCKSLC